MGLLSLQSYQKAQELDKKIGFFGWTATEYHDQKAAATSEN